MKRLRLLTIVGTRPEIIRLSRVLPMLDIHFDHKLIHTGQNYDYELNKIFFEQLCLKEPDIFLNCAEDTKSPSELIANIIKKVDKILEELKPEAILILGDTNSCLSVIPAKRRKIPIFHMEAGNRCFDSRVPEEINRKIVDHTSDINLTYSNIAREYLIREGLPPDQIIKVGSPMKEVLNFYLPKIKKSSILKNLDLEKNNFFLVSLHRDENMEIKRNFDKIVLALNLLAEDYKKVIIFSTHPRTRRKIEKEKIKFNRLIKLIKPFGFLDYLKLQLSSICVISDSGTITEESSILGFPAINVRENHERPEGMEEASVILSGLDYKRIKQSINVISTLKKDDEKSLIVKDYDVDALSQKIVKIIYSYTDYVNKYVWRKI